VLKAVDVWVQNRERSSLALGRPASCLGPGGFLDQGNLQEGKREAVRAGGGGGRELPALCGWAGLGKGRLPRSLKAFRQVLLPQEPQALPAAGAGLTFVRSTPVMARTEAGISASRRFTSDVVLLLSPLRITISSTLERGAATLAAIWGGREGGQDEQRAKELLSSLLPKLVGPFWAPRRPGPGWELPTACLEQSCSLLTSGSASSTRASWAASPYFLSASAFSFILSASAIPMASITKASASPILRIFSASAWAMRTCFTLERETQPSSSPDPRSVLSAASLPPPATCLPCREPTSLPPHASPACSRAQGWSLSVRVTGSLTSRPRRSAGCGRLPPRPAASQWLSAPSPSARSPSLRHRSASCAAPPRFQFPPGESSAAPGRSGARRPAGPPQSARGRDEKRGRGHDLLCTDIRTLGRP